MVFWVETIANASSFPPLSSYLVCEKSDGVRYLLYMSKDGDGEELHYLIDRKNEFWEMYQKNLHFPLASSEAEFHTHTLIDGELVMDTTKDGRREPKFLAFDCLVIDGRQLVGRPLDKRLGYLNQEIMKPYRALFEKYPAEKAQQAFVVDAKRMELPYAIELMFREIVPKLKHGNDGLIFTCVPSSYQYGTDPHILKWKPSNENTVDFRLRLEFPTVQADDDQLAQGFHEQYVDYDSVPVGKLMVFHGNSGGSPSYQLFRPDPPFTGDLYISEEEWETLKSLEDPLQNRVVECGLDEKNRWRIHRFRDDKQEGNHVSVVRSVLESVIDGVSEKELLEAAYGIKESWKSRHTR
jgi:mRNA guanylyltransferase